MTKFVHLAGVRLSSLSGHVAALKPGVPTELPEPLALIARQNGCLPENEVDPSVLKALAASNAPAKDAPAPEAATADIDSLLRDAVDIILARGNEADLVKDKSRPRLGAVRAELPEGVEITSEQLDAFLAAA